VRCAPLELIRSEESNRYHWEQMHRWADMEDRSYDPKRYVDGR
jgi:hypothetical protein